MLPVRTRTIGVVAIVLFVVTSAGIATAGVSTASQDDGSIEQTDVQLAITTAWADPIDETDALLAANVTKLDGTDGAWVWFEYRAEGDDRWLRVDGDDVQQPRLVRAEVTDLEPGTTYEYRALVTDWNETTAVTGETKTFTTEAAIEVDVRTESADALGETEMLLAGNLTRLEGEDRASTWFEIRPEGGETWTYVAGQAMNSTGPFTAAVDSLESATTYEYRALATDWNQSTFATGETKTFTTLHTPPNVTTDPVPDDTVDDSSAVLNATVRDLGSAEEVDVFFWYRVATSSTWDHRTTVTTISEPQTVSQRVDGLSAETTYEYQAFAVAGEHGDSVDVGEQRAFTTAPILSVVTDAVTNVTDTSAVVHGTVARAQWSDDLSVAVAYRERGGSTWERTDATLASDASFRATVIDLEPGTIYEFRAVAEEGGATDVGAVITATTDELPVVHTGLASTVDESSATVAATLDDLGGASSASLLVEYRRQGDEHWQTSDGETLVDPGTVDVVLTDLDDETTYEYRAVAVASDGYSAAGSVRTFTTDAAEQPPAVDRLVADEDSPPNPHAELSIEWSASDVDGDLESVAMTVHDERGQVVHSSSESVSGTTASGSAALTVKHGAGETYVVTVEVLDAAGAVTTEQTTVDA